MAGGAAVRALSPAPGSDLRRCGPNLAGTKVLGQFFHQEWPATGCIVLFLLSGYPNDFSRLDRRHVSRQGVGSVVAFVLELESVGAGGSASGKPVATAGEVDADPNRRTQANARKSNIPAKVKVEEWRVGRRDRLSSA
jgi:hypothetical protein